MEGSAPPPVGAERTVCAELTYDLFESLVLILALGLEETLVYFVFMEASKQLL